MSFLYEESFSDLFVAILLKKFRGRGIDKEICPKNLKNVPVRDIIKKSVEVDYYEKTKCY